MNKIISIKKAKGIREDLGFTHLIIFGVSEDAQHQIITHGRTAVEAKEAADMGNSLKKELGWPIDKCISKPLERICGNCSFWQRGIHYAGYPIESNMHGKCMFTPNPIKRYEQDRASGNFEPNR